MGFFLLYQEFEKDENFEITLKGTTGGAQLGKLKRTVITIINDDGKDKRFF